jgi:hypothetical protein
VGEVSPWLGWQMVELYCVELGVVWGQGGRGTGEHVAQHAVLAVTCAGGIGAHAAGRTGLEICWHTVVSLIPSPAISLDQSLS